MIAILANVEVIVAHQFVSLCDCNDDVSGHLAGNHLSRECLAEHQLILARAGLFHLNDDQLQCMKICPKHRHNLGRFWRPVRSCQYPIHRGRPRNIKGNRVINLQTAKEIQPCTIKPFILDHVSYMYCRK